MHRIRVLAGGILLLAAGPFVTSSDGKGAMSFDRVEYTIATMEEAPQVLVVEADGKATCESHSNMYSLADPQIGTYQTGLATAQMEDLSAALAEPAFGTLPDHWGKVNPSEPYRRIRVVRESKAREKLVTSRLPIDPRLQAVLKLLDKLTAEVKAHPLGTLQIKITRAELRGHSLRVMFSLENTGTQSIIIRSPADLWQVPDGGMAVEVWPDRKGAPADEVKQVEIQSLKSVLPETGGPLEIQPEGSISYGLIGEVEMPATPYVVRVDYRSLKKEWDDKKLLYGELFAVPAKITVVNASAVQ